MKKAMIIADLIYELQKIADEGHYNDEIEINMDGKWNSVDIDVVKYDDKTKVRLTPFYFEHVM